MQLRKTQNPKVRPTKKKPQKVKITLPQQPIINEQRTRQILLGHKFKPTEIAFILSKRRISQKIMIRFAKALTKKRWNVIDAIQQAITKQSITSEGLHQYKNIEELIQLRLAIQNGFIK